MDADERDIVNYLKSMPRLFVSAKEISRRASGKRRYREEPHWALPVLVRMLEQGVVVQDSSHYYRLREAATKERPQKWISPQMQRILDRRGKPEETFELDDPDEKPPA
jgi:hypothetical protein